MSPFFDYIIFMYEITIKKRTLKSIQKMPEPIQRKMANLVEDLRDKGLVKIGRIIASSLRINIIAIYPIVGSLAGIANVIPS